MPPFLLGFARNVWDEGLNLLNQAITRPPLMDALLVLHSNSINEISPHSLGFLNEHFKSHEDLSRVQSLSTELKKECGDLDRNLIILRNNLSSLISSWISRSNSIRRVFHQLNLKIRRFGIYTSQDGMEKTNLRKIPKILDEELPMLAKEVRRIEMVRSYAETTLRLEAMVGDLEDAVSCIMNQNTRTIFSVDLPQTSSSTDIRWKLEKLLLAVKTMNAIEEAVVSIAKTRPQWCRLLKSVDARLDKPMGLLRLQALADHRALIASIGWPPPLLTSELEKGTALTNPLVLMQGETREGYSQSFLALCALQHLQTRRGGRLLNIPGHHRNHELHLWAIDELVSPIASRFEHHFSKWSDEPKFIFALVYKITKDYIGGIDDVLQPLIDKAMLMGCSAKEAWVSAMSRTLSAYLTKGMFSVLSERYSKKNEKSEAIFSWLHLVDLIISFDKRMQSLANLGTPLSLGQPVQFEQISRGMSILSIFCDRPDWFKMWAKIELKDAQMKLKAELENERAWMVNDRRGSESCTQGKAEPFLLSTTEDYKAPRIAESVVNITRAVIERCQTLPSIKLQAQFIRLSTARVLWHFFSILLHRCEEAECTTGDAETDSLMRVSVSINAARYCESILQEWSEDVNFLEMRIAEDDLNTQVRSDLVDRSCFFWEEIKCLMKMETDWVAELMADLLRQFDTLSWEYVQNKEQWSNKQKDLTPKNGLGSGDLTLSTGLVEALDALRIRLQVLKDGLNSKDFLDLWRSVADGVDQFIFGSIVMSDARFSDHGVAQFITDMGALFLVFRPFCARPEAFLPRIRDSLKLFEMVSKDAKQLQSVLSTGGKKIECLRVCGIVHVSSNQAEKILKNRSFVV